MPPTKNSLDELLANLDADFKLSCPKCKSRNVHTMTATSIWSKASEYSFVCYTCGLRKYGEEVIYGLVEDLRHEWDRAAKERAEEKVRRAEEGSEKARLREVIGRHRVEQRIREEEERREADAKATAARQAWLAEMGPRNSEPRPQPVVKPAPAPAPAPTPKPELEPEPEPDLTPKEQRRQSQARYRDANRERRREGDRLRRVRLRKAKEAEVITPLPEPTPEPEVRPVIGDGVALCAWEPCGSPAQEGSKYCSRNCSNKNARLRAKERANS